MDIRGIAAKATKIAMTVAGTAKETVTLNLGHSGTYDPQTDTTTAGGTEYVVQAVPYRRQNRQDKDDVSGNTETLAIEAAQLPADAVITEQDTLTRTPSGVWQIVTVQNAVGALWILDIRH